MKAPVVLDEEEKNVKCWAELLLYDFSEMEMFSYSVQKKLCIYVFIQWKHLFYEHIIGVIEKVFVFCWNLLALMVIK